jgi:transposase-like protein
LVGLAGGDLWPLAFMMTKISYSGYRFPPVIIQQAIWLYARFTLSFRDVEDLLAERGITVSYETVRRWVNHFGSAIATDLRNLWRAVDAEGEVLDVLVQASGTSGLH